MNSLITTFDGSHTIYLPEIDEHYHSIHGAVQESDHIFIKNGFDICTADPLFIFEVGFGTGLNAMLTAIKALRGKRAILYTSIEKYPLGKTMIRSLNHKSFAGAGNESIFDKIHSSRWNDMVQICENFKLKKIRADLLTITIQDKFDLIYFDAFGPDKQPEMWTREVFSKIAGITNKEGIFVTYSAKGEVKRNLKAAGFQVILLPGPPGKRQMISAIKK
jgi:tRNA U34 5-methylaminomethyl-2-thiouridine-forming methyltransferase MnmC